MNSNPAHLFALALLASCTPAPPANTPAEPEASVIIDVSTAAASASATLALTSKPPTSSSPPLQSSTGTGSDEPGASAPEHTAAIASDGSLAPSRGAAPAEPVLPADASGPAVGGPRNNRPCVFHESVDVYDRLCTTRRNPDGSLHVEAKGTRLNPDNGFEFTMHGGPHNFFAHGTLNAFGICEGPFTAYVHTVVDKGVTTYELRFKEHCKIVIR